MTVDNYQGKKFQNNNILHVDDHLTVEQALQININNSPFTITMRTPGDDTHLIKGLLYSEDVYRSNKTLNISFSENEERNTTEANITLDESLLRNGYLNSRNILSVSSCGICGKKELEKIDTNEKLEDEHILPINNLFSLFDKMKKKQLTFHQSGGSHAAAAFTKDNQLLTIMEDVGRHNAVDKVIGYLMNVNKLKEAKCIIVSGRVSYEIVVKVFASKIPILAAVSAPSTLAVDFAKELGITLVAFCRNHKATCYSHPYRIQ